MDKQLNNSPSIAGHTRKYVLPEAVVIDMLVLLAIAEHGPLAGAPDSLAVRAFEHLPIAVYSYLSDLLDVPDGEVAVRIEQRIADVSLGKVGDYRL